MTEDRECRIRDLSRHLQMLPAKEEFSEHAPVAHRAEGLQGNLTFNHPYRSLPEVLGYSISVAPGAIPRPLFRVVAADRINNAPPSVLNPRSAQYISLNRMHLAPHKSGVFGEPSAISCRTHNLRQ